MIAQVYLNTGNLNIDKPFDYEIPPQLSGKVLRGVRVKVPFGGGNIPKEAFVTAVKEESNFSELKAIKSVTDEMPVLSDRAIELCFLMRERYFCTFSEAARAMLPPGSGVKFEEWISAVKGFEEIKEDLSARQEQLMRLLYENEGSAEMLQIKNELGKSARSVVNALVKKGYCEKSFRDKRKNNEKFVRVAYYCGEDDAEAVAAEIEKKMPKQAAVLRVLSGGEKLTVPDILSAAKTTRNAVEALFVKGLIKYTELEVLRSPLEGKKQQQKPPLKLTKEQAEAVQKITQEKEGTYLLHGVTGSGKTEVFMRVVSECIKRGKQAIVLVPEISLTPQMTERFYDRFGETVAVIHSALSLGERLDEHKRIKRGEAKVIVGARSAIFAPCSDIGVVIIDEEHEQSYKSEASPRYHAAEIAAFLCEKFSCPLVLASATPSCESYYKAMTGEYKLIELKNRINNNPLPSVYIEDMREELKQGNKTVLSRRLAYEINLNIAEEEQSIIFLNRRGYSTFVSCRECGFVFSCPSCSVSLTYHKNDGFLTCHYCGHRERVKSTCPKCGSNKIKDFGKGTQKAQEQIESIFPNAKILRMDTDTTSGKRGHEKLLDRFVQEKTDILLGTQMVTKGLDFENVTLVGVLAADSSLNIDDFRAQERTFNLITQVCGRAGRGKKPGRAVVQTYMPENSTLLLAAKQDYKAFYEEEIEYRKAFSYPPFCDIINITISSTDKDEAENAAAHIALELKTALRNEEDCTVFSAAPAPIAKALGRYRFRVWLKCRANEFISGVIRETIHLKYGKRNSDMAVCADLNPYNMS